MKKLIKQCKEFVEENPTYYGLELSVSDVKLIVEALEKQIPKKPMKIDREHFITDNCRMCEKTMVIENAYCPSCGQAIDWED